MAAIGLLIAWLIVVPTFVVLGIRSIARESDGSGGSHPTRKAIGVIDLAFAAAVGLTPVVAWRVAVASTGWVDSDRDGMLDGFVAGQYDLFDFVVPSAVVWGLGLTVVVVAIREVLRRRAIPSRRTQDD